MTLNGALFVRIDDRLIHGQVVEGWLPSLQASAVLVVSNAAAGDPVQETLMAIALPEGVELQVARVQDAAERVSALAAAGKRLLVLTPGPREALALLLGLRASTSLSTDSAVSVRSVNVGGMHHSAGKVQVGKAIFLSAEDKEALRAIAALGVVLEGRAVPSERPSDLSELLK